MRQISFTRFIVDEWAFDSVMGLNLPTLSSKYKQMK
jgi:hypothetical protein